VLPAISSPALPGASDAHLATQLLAEITEPAPRASLGALFRAAAPRSAAPSYVAFAGVFADRGAQDRAQYMAVPTAEVKLPMVALRLGCTSCAHEQQRRARTGEH
jgi:hypothetical protein